MKVSIRKNAWDNWYGYIGGKIVIAFASFDGPRRAEERATEWLFRMKSQPDSVHREILRGLFGGRK